MIVEDIEIQTGIMRDAVTDIKMSPNRFPNLNVRETHRKRTVAKEKARIGHVQVFQSFTKIFGIVNRTLTWLTVAIIVITFNCTHLGHHRKRIAGGNPDDSEEWDYEEGNSPDQQTTSR